MNSLLMVGTGIVVLFLFGLLAGASNMEREFHEKILSSLCTLEQMHSEEIRLLKRILASLNPPAHRLKRILFLFCSK